jgi:hypothetical protein
MLIQRNLSLPVSDRDTSSLPTDIDSSVDGEGPPINSNDSIMLLPPSFLQYQQLISQAILTSEFFKECWEKKPCHYLSSSSALPLITSLFSKQFLLLLSKMKINGTSGGGGIPYENNLNIMKYISNQRVGYNLKNPHENISKQTLKRVFQEGYTIQFFQPQRFSDSLFYLCAAFEEFFGTLAGSSSYLTPPNTQGLAPHWDDVEVFILQTEGTKQWNLWKPSGIPLPDTPSHDIPRCSLSATPDMQLTLSPGDLLYLPRGTIHEAVALETFSTHITISVYQKFHTKTLTETLFPTLLDKFFERIPKDPTTTPLIRKGLPVNVSSLLGSQIANKIRLESKLPSSSSSPFPPGAGVMATGSSELIESRRQEFTNQLKEMLHDLIDSLEEDDIDAAIDILNDDFCSHRLPDPTQHEITTHTAGMKKKSTSSSSLRSVEWEEKSLRIGSYKSMNALMTVLSRLQDAQRSSEIFLKFFSSWLHCRPQIVDGVQLLLIGTGKRNNRLNHMGHPSVVDQEMKAGEESLGDGFDWVKLTFPFRYQELITLLAAPNDWFSFDRYLSQAKQQRFIEEEVRPSPPPLSSLLSLSLTLFRSSRLSMSFTELVSWTLLSSVGGQMEPPSLH